MRTALGFVGIALFLGCHRSDGLPPSGPPSVDLASFARRDFAGADLAGLSLDPCHPGDPTAVMPVCRAVEFRFAPGASNYQIAIWIEDAKGGYVDTAYLTRLTGQLGVANRPGDGLLKTDFRWPYGRREMIAPVWAHRRNHHYPKIVMGGVCGNSPKTLCPDQTLCDGDCNDNSIVYHERVSSSEPFYCSPSGASQIDATTCASRGTFSKGAYADAAFSLYPPRADLVAFSPADSPDARDFAKQNDLVAVSAATPAGIAEVRPAPSWFPARQIPDGDYVAWIEISQESDFNAAHNHPNHTDPVHEWDFEGHPFLGQPSIVWRAPFHLGGEGGSFPTTEHAGYGDWDGATGTLHAPDGTITDGLPGSGAGRLLGEQDACGAYRFKVVVGSCP